MRPHILFGLTLLAPLAAATALAAPFVQVRTYDGTVAAGEFGYACVVISDMDGDGNDEFAIGAPGDDTGGAAAGRVFIYRGGHPLDATAAWVITGAPGERLGHALSAGDVDGDSRPDLIIGAPGSEGAPGTLTGRVAVAYGGSPLGNRAIASVPGTTPGGRFGWAVQGGFWYGVGPIRFLVGAPAASAGAGEVHGFAGGDPPPAAREFILHGVAAGERFGTTLADAGITQGFGIGSEFVVGAPDAAGNGPGSGRYATFAYHAPGDTTPVSGATGAAGARLGESIAGGHDINPNFFEPTDDIVIGAPGADPGGLIDAGNTFAYVGGAPFTYQGAASQAAFGSTVRLVRDATGTWLPDLAVGESGAVRLFAGPLHSNSTPVATFLAEEAGDGFGHAISDAGNLDPTFSGRRQFLIGAPDHAGAGRVYIFTDLAPPTGVTPAAGPGIIRLAATGPNPTRGAFAMTVELPRPGRARLTVVDLAGRTVAALHDGPLGLGRTAFTWSPGAASAAGLYWGVLEADGVRETQRLIRVR